MKMSKDTISRRDLFGVGIGAMATAGLAPLAFTKPAYAAGSGGLGGASPDAEAESYLNSINQAIAFQEMMMDAYATGNTVR
ncbi:MAG: hypothetical protein WBX22_14160, partial [Silvibacterium sp.]